MALPNMGLVLPIDHASADVWDTILDAVFGLVDAHDHTTGKGVKVPSAGLNINADLSFISHAITNALALDMVPTTTASVAAYSSAMFVNSADNNLYFRNAAGNNVQITAGNIINVAVAGAIGGDYGSVGALLDFVDANDTYHFMQQLGAGVRQYGKVAHADLDLFEYKANPAAGVPANRVRHKSPVALAASYDLTWLAALPASGRILQVDAAGLITATNALANNVNLQLQGTGYVQRGSRTTTIPIPTGNICIAQGGTVSTSSGGAAKPGAQLAVSTIALVPVNLPDADDELSQITTISMNNSIVGTGNVTVQPFVLNSVLNILSSIGPSTAAAIGNPIAVPLTAPTTLNAGDTLYVSVTTAGTNSGAIQSFRVSSTVP